MTHPQGRRGVVDSKEISSVEQAVQAIADMVNERDHGLTWDEVCDKSCVWCIQRGLWTGELEEKTKGEGRAPEVVIAGTNSWQRRWDELGATGERQRVVVQQVHVSENGATLVGSLEHDPGCSVVGELVFPSGSFKCIRQEWRVSGLSPLGPKPVSQGRRAITPPEALESPDLELEGSYPPRLGVLHKEALTAHPSQHHDRTAPGTGERPVSTLVSALILMLILTLIGCTRRVSTTGLHPGQERHRVMRARSSSDAGAQLAGLLGTQIPESKPKPDPKSLLGLSGSKSPSYTGGLIETKAGGEARASRTRYATMGASEASRSAPGLLSSHPQIGFRIKGLEDLETVKQVGKGSFGTVWAARSLDGKEIFALKVVDARQAEVEERDILETLDHPFIVRLHFSFQIQGSICPL